jgi:hypothetical protein
MNVKQMIVFFSVSAVFFLFILIYNVYAQNADICGKAEMQSDGLYNTKTSLSPSDNFKIDGIKNTESDLNFKPKFTSRPKPAQAPAIVKNETEAKALFPS